MNWERLASYEFDEAIEKSKGVCVIPLGCIEKHGQHMPTGTDSMKIQYTMEKVAQIEEVMVFPVTMWLGDVCGYHARTGELLERRKMKGGIGINPELLCEVLEELCDEIYRNGFRKILLVNSHGGNIGFLNFFVRGIRYKKKGYAVMWTSGSAGVQTFIDILDRRAEFPDITDEDVKTLERIREKGTGGGHADMREVAQVMAIDPKLIHEDMYEAESGASTHNADYLEQAGVQAGFIWDANYPNMYDGYPSYGCSKAIGDAVVQLNAERIAKIIKTIKDDEKCVLMARNEFI